MPPNNRNSPKFVIGVFLVLMGVVLALDQLRLVQADHLLRFWPAALIILGLVMLRRGERQSALRALVLIVVGGWLLLNTLGLVSLDLWGFIWPLLLVFIGARIMMHNQGSGSNASRDLPGAASPMAGTTSTGQTGPGGYAPAAPNSGEPVHTSMFSLLSGSKRRWGKSVFRGAEATAFMGGCELDLRDALMSSGELAVIDVFVIMGGVNIFVPPNWTVSLEVVPLMGGVHDKTRSVPSNPAQHLLVRGTVVMGGVEISN
ncbi:MAG: cell wall-active antibiotics response protein [Pseudomonadota bacterium]|nr:cell wall-active antibiotics response protein [Pseudomonadota bacterium]